uniref:Ig-like domain-containing protein n=1 Tax=Calidris pygmaea TaxID=425635 RepID=A0A8C3JT72_9CHAR
MRSIGGWGGDTIVTPRVPSPHLVGAFMMHVASSCPLAATNGSVLGFDFTIVFNKNPLVCYHPDAKKFFACDRGLLRPVAIVVAFGLNNDTAWLERAESRRRACHQLAPHLWATTGLRRTPPQVRIVPEPLGDTDAVLLTCHVWGFYPPPVTVLWWHRGHVVATGDKAKLLPSGNWTYQTQVTLRVTPKVGDTFTCSVQHASLDQPLQEHWSPDLTVKVVLAAVTMTLGLGIFATGTFIYCHRAPGEGH